MSWDEAVADLHDAAFETFGRDAVYTPAGGVAQAAAVRVIVKRDASHIALGPGFRDLQPAGASEWTLEVRAADIADGIVRKSDAFTVANVGAFVVSQEPKADVMAALWVCPVRLSV